MPPHSLISPPPPSLPSRPSRPSRPCPPPPPFRLPPPSPLPLLPVPSPPSLPSLLSSPCPPPPLRTPSPNYRVHPQEALPPRPRGLLPPPAAADGRATKVSCFRSFRFFELSTSADTGNCSAERPCFFSDHMKPPLYRGSRQNRRKGIFIGHVTCCATCAPCSICASTCLGLGVRIWG